MVVGRVITTGATSVVRNVGGTVGSCGLSGLVLEVCGPGVGIRRADRRRRLVLEDLDGDEQRDRRDGQDQGERRDVASSGRPPTGPRATAAARPATGQARRADASTAGTQARAACRAGSRAPGSPGPAAPPRAWRRRPRTRRGPPPRARSPARPHPRPRRCRYRPGGHLVRRRGSGPGHSCRSRRLRSAWPPPRARRPARRRTRCPASVTSSRPDRSMSPSRGGSPRSRGSTRSEAPGCDAAVPVMLLRPRDRPGRHVRLMRMRH